MGMTKNEENVQRDRDQENTLVTEFVSHPASEWNDGGQRQRIASIRPLIGVISSHPLNG